MAFCFTALIFAATPQDNNLGSEYAAAHRELTYMVSTVRRLSQFKPKIADEHLPSQDEPIAVINKKLFGAKEHILESIEHQTEEERTRTKEAFSQILQTPDGETIFLRNSFFLPEWQTIKNMSIHSARNLMLQKEQEYSKGQSVSAFGFNFDSQLLMLVFPFSCVIVLLTFLTHVNNFLLELKSGSLSYASFPCMVLYEDMLSYWISATSLVLIPAAAMYLLISNYLPSVPSVENGVAFALSTIAGILGAIVFIRSRLLVQQIKKHRQNAS